MNLLVSLFSGSYLLLSLPSLVAATPICKLQILQRRLHPTAGASTLFPRFPCAFLSRSSCSQFRCVRIQFSSLFYLSRSCCPALRLHTRYPREELWRRCWWYFHVITACHGFMNGVLTACGPCSKDGVSLQCLSTLPLFFIYHCLLSVGATPYYRHYMQYILLFSTYVRVGGGSDQWSDASS